MNYVIKALFLAFVMFLMLDIVKTASERVSNSVPTYSGIVAVSCRDLCK